MGRLVYFGLLAGATLLVGLASWSNTPPSLKYLLMISLQLPNLSLGLKVLSVGSLSVIFGKNLCIAWTQIQICRKLLGWRVPQTVEIRGGNVCGAFFVGHCLDNGNGVFQQKRYSLGKQFVPVLAQTAWQPS